FAGGGPGRGGRREGRKAPCQRAWPLCLLPTFSRAPIPKRGWLVSARCEQITLWLDGLVGADAARGAPGRRDPVMRREAGFFARASEQTPLAGKVGSPRLRDQIGAGPFSSWAASPSRVASPPIALPAMRAGAASSLHLVSSC